MRILPYPLTEPLSFDGYIRLAADGPELSIADRRLRDFAAGWQLAVGEQDDRGISSRCRRGRCMGWKTAYPRVSKLGTDPDNGLASIEALYLAYHILGRPMAGCSITTTGRGSFWN